MSAKLTVKAISEMAAYARDHSLGDDAYHVMVSASRAAELEGEGILTRNPDGSYVWTQDVAV